MVDRLICLAGGTFVGDGEPAEVLANPAVREVFLGTEVDRRARPARWTAHRPRRTMPRVTDRSEP